MRAAIISLTAVGVATYPQQRSNLDWPVGLIIGILSSIGFSLWLARVRSDPSVVLADPYSWTAPFFPMRRYPLRYLWLGSLSLTIAGGAGILRAATGQHRRAGFAAAFLIWGLCIAATLYLWARSLGVRSNGGA